MIGSWWYKYILSQESSGKFKLNQKKIRKDRWKLIYLRDRVKQLYEMCEKKDIKLYVWAWPQEVSRFLINEPYFIEIEYNNKKYESYNNLVNTHPKFSLGKKGGDLREYGVTDEHPSKSFHKLISETLLNKIVGENGKN